MRKHLCLVAAASMAIAGFSYAPATAAADTLSPTTQPSGQVANSTESRAIRASLANVTNSALMHNGFSDLSQYVQQAPNTIPSTPDVGPNRTTAGNSSSSTIIPGSGANNHANETAQQQPQDTAPGTIATANKPGQAFKNYDDINNAVDQLNKDWKDKYGNNFNLSAANQSMVFNDTFQVYQGDIGQSARTASERMSPDNAANNNNNNANNGDIKSSAGLLDASAHMATVYVPESGSMPAITLTLTNQGDAPDAWKIAVPGGVGEQQIHDSLLKHLNTLHDSRANWPADQNDAYRAVSREVLGAFSDACMAHAQADAANPH